MLWQPHQLTLPRWRHLGYGSMAHNAPVLSDSVVFGPIKSWYAFLQLKFVPSYWSSALT
jgi:hypothetical protein